MKEYDRTICFNHDIDNLLKGEQENIRENNSPEYDELLELANTLRETDFSTESDAKEKIWHNLRSNHQVKSLWFKQKGDFTMKKLFKQYRPGYIMGVGALIAVLAVTFIFPGTMEAVANNIAKVFKVGKGVTIIQTDGESRPAPLLSKEQLSSEKVKVAVEGENSETNSDSQVKDIIHKSIAEAQKAVDFKVLVPEYLPTGYTLKEAKTMELVGADINSEEAKSSRYYLTVKFAGQEKDITVFYRLVNEETAYETGTENEIEAVKINDTIGAWEDSGHLIWEQDGVSYNMICKGISKEEAVKIAKSFK